MYIKAPKYRTSHADRDLQCQESIEGVMQEILAKASMQVGVEVETINAMDVVLRNLRLAYAADPDPEDVSGEFDHEPSNDWPAATP